MKYVEVKVEHLAACSEVQIEHTPEEAGIQCLKIADEYFMPFTGWLKFDVESGEWVEIDPEEEESLMIHLTENVNFREISDKEAGEKFSNDVEFVD